MTFTMPAKDPDEVLDYQLDWTKRLDGDAIADSEAIIEQGDITLESESFSGAIQTIWVSGGTAGTLVLVTLRVETLGGRTYDETMKFKVKER